MKKLNHCGGHDHFGRRNALKLMGLSGLAWLTPLGEAIAYVAEKNPKIKAKSLILLWLDGGNSQLETFDPHAGSKIAQGTKAIDTSLKGIQFAAGMPQSAEVMDSFSLIRNVVSKEGDHERANYNVKTGFRPDPTLVHPSIGALLTHELPEGKTEIVPMDAEARLASGELDLGESETEEPDPPKNHPVVSPSDP